MSCIVWAHSRYCHSPRVPDLSRVVKTDVEHDSGRCGLIDGAGILCSLSLRVVEIRRDRDKLQWIDKT